MRFVDFALQGFLDLRGAAQVKFGSTLTSVVTGEVAPKTVFDGLLEAVFAEGYDPAAVRFSAPGASSTRAVVTFQTADETVFRLVRDVVRGSAQLLQYRTESNEFTPVASSSVEIAQFLRGRVGVPNRDLYEKAFVISPGDLPSQKAITSKSVSATESRPTAPAGLTAQEREILAQRLQQLRSALAAHEQVAAVEYELDGLQKRRFDLESEIQRRDVDSAAVDEAQKRYELLSYLDSLPEDFALKVENYHEAVERRARELERWQDERKELERDRRTIHVEPIVRDWRLWAGLGVGVVALTTGLLLRGPFRLIALADIPAFGLSAFVLWQHLDSLELRDVTRRKLELSDRRKELIVTRDDEEIREVEEALTAIGHQPEDIDEVVKRLEGLQVAKAELESAKRAFRDATNDPELIALKKEHQQVRQQVGDLETQLASSSLGGEVTSVSDEIKELERQLEGHTVAQPPSPIAEASRQDNDDRGPVRDFLLAASELLLCDIDDAARKISEAGTPIVNRMTGGQLTALSVSSHGELRVTEGLEPRQLLALPPATQDVAYLSMRAGLIAVLSDRMRAPFLVSGLDEVLPGGAPFIIAFASLLAQSNQTVCFSRAISEGWPDGTSLAMLASS